jgi:hypothetical protein
MWAILIEIFIKAMHCTSYDAQMAMALSNGAHFSSLPGLPATLIN